MEDDDSEYSYEGPWKIEAKAAIKDIVDHVADVKISNVLCNTSLTCYINLTTLEGLKFCIELCSRGYSIVARRYDHYEFDRIKYSEEKFFETIHSLLNFVSPKYTSSFDKMLLTKLKKLN